MAKFYIDTNIGSDDSNGNGTIKYPYKSIEYCLTVNTLIEDTKIILRSGEYPLTHTAMSKITSAITIDIEGLGYDTTINFSGDCNKWINAGYKNSKLKLTKVIVKDTGLTTAIALISKFTNTSGYRYTYLYYIAPLTEFIFRNVAFILSKVPTVGGVAPPAVNLVEYAFIHPIYSNVRFINCIVPARTSVFANKSYCVVAGYDTNTYQAVVSANFNIYVTNCYGSFNGDTQNWVLYNNLFTLTPNLDSKYTILDTVANTNSLGVYYGSNSWFFTNFIIFMNNKYYSLKEEFYDINSKMYKPITLEDITVKGFNYYTVSNMSEFVSNVTIGGVTSKKSPVMTNNNTPSPYVITSSGNYDTTNYLPWKAFNGTNSSSTDCWITPNNTVKGWIMIDLGVETTINSFNLSTRFTSDIKSCPKDFTLQGSHDGINFNIIKTITGEINWSVAEQRTYNLDSDATYRYYKIDISANNGQVYSCISEISFYYTSPIIETYKPIDKFDNFKIVADTNNIIKVNGIKSSKELIISSGDIRLAVASNISYLKLLSNLTGESDIRIAYSTDAGLTWYSSQDGVTFTNLELIIPIKSFDSMSDLEKSQYNIACNTIAQIGMTSSIFNSINFNTINKFKIRFAYVLIRKKYNETCELTDLSWKYDAKGYMQELKDNEYDLEVYNHRVQLIPKIDNNNIEISIIT